MTRLRVAPARRHGRDRLYVSLPGGTAVAWYDQDAGRVSLLPGASRDDVLTALAPYLSGEVTVGPPPVPTPADLDRLSLHPDDDLAPNRPGEELHAGLDARPASASRWFNRDPRPGELLAHQILGERLDLLEGAGWRVLHSIPLPGAARIDHLAIGPAGVLAVRTLNARKQRVQVNDPLVGTGRAAPLPQLRWARRAAERASHALAAAVCPVLAVVEASRLDVPPALPDVRILRDTEIPELASLGGVLKPADIEALYATARDRRTWLRV
ncbi:nuclease-related domain-containing protein [Streptomyces sp. NPDC006923]|uniref:nuclease-related domain-containing protein n=1 Tax=Streptomyces sp. NPDC006923 TaxID=3155355 RepID=UPI0033F4FD0E